MNGKQLKDKMNGKKRYVIGGVGTVVGLRFLIPFLISMNATVVATETTVKSHTERIGKVEKKSEEVPKQIASIDSEVKGLKEDVKGLRNEFVDFRGEQRKANDKLYNTIMAK